MKTTLIAAVIVMLILISCGGGSSSPFEDPAFRACVQYRLDQYSEIDKKAHNADNLKDLEIIYSLGCEGGG